MTIVSDVRRDTFEAFAKLCRTNTGSSPGDSGQAYGYRYQKPVADEKSPALRITVDCGYLSQEDVSAEQWERGSSGVYNAESSRFYKIADYQPGDVCSASVNISLPHFLNTMLEADNKVDQLQRMFERFDRMRGYDSWQETLEEFCSFLSARGVAANWITAGNTYNSDNDFDQDLQFNIFEVDGENLVAIQPHCGCDIRGGYPMPQIYRFVDEDYFYDWQVDFHGYFEAPETPLFKEYTGDDFEVNYENVYEFDRGGASWDYRFKCYGEGEKTRFVVGSDGVTAIPQVFTPWGTWEEVWAHSNAEGF